MEEKQLTEMLQTMGKFFATEKGLEVESTLLGFSQQMSCHLGSALFMPSNQNHMRAFGEAEFSDCFPLQSVRSFPLRNTTLDWILLRS